MKFTSQLIVLAAALMTAVSADPSKKAKNAVAAIKASAKKACAKNAATKKKPLIKPVVPLPAAALNALKKNGPGKPGKPGKPGAKPGKLTYEQKLLAKYKNLRRVNGLRHVATVMVLNKYEISKLRRQIKATKDPKKKKAMARHLKTRKLLLRNLYLTWKKNKTVISLLKLNNVKMSQIKKASGSTLKPGKKISKKAKKTAKKTAKKAKKAKKTAKITSKKAAKKAKKTAKKAAKAKKA